MPATAAEFGARLFKGADPLSARAAQGRADPLALAGCVPPYAIPTLLVEHVPVALPLSTGRMRGNAAALGCFLIETFVDELAVRSGREGLSYRMAMLGQDIRLANCLQRAATLAEWSGGRGGSGQGLACHRMTLNDREGRIALVASARKDERGIRVDKLTAVLDIGRVVNLDIARQQVEGGLLFGLGLARGQSTAYADGLPLSGRLSQLGLPLLADCPEIEIEFIEGDAPPFDPGELGVFIDEESISTIEKKMEKTGYLDGSEMAGTFSMLRANDLVWSFVINNYLMGKDPFPFDLLYWNSDSTRMPRAMHSFYLRNMYLKNILKDAGGLTLGGVPIDIRKVKTPCYFVSAIEDHIAPWISTYMGVHLPSGPVNFVLGGSGHIAGIVNPPAGNKYCYWTNAKLPATAQEWFNSAKQHEGSWWPNWEEWVEAINDKKVAARVPGAGPLKAIEDAPGSYVKMRADAKKPAAKAKAAKA